MIYESCRPCCISFLYTRSRNWKTHSYFWKTNNCHRPHSEPEKLDFLEELKTLQPTIQGEWLISGDFNLIYKLEDKNNSRLNSRFMGKFKAVLDDLKLKELPLHGRIWSWFSLLGSLGPPGGHETAWLSSIVDIMGPCQARRSTAILL
jgi:hypothetical protein